MKACDYCGEELNGSYLQVNRDFFNEGRLEFEEAAFCDKDCFMDSLAEGGAIWNKGVNDDED